MITVLCATKDGALPQGLEHIPGSHHLIYSTTPGWAIAANELLSEAERLGHDALFLDDDVTLLPETFAQFACYEPHADVFGFTLTDERGSVLSAGHVLTANGTLLPRGAAKADTAAYVAHVTASCLYIKHHVLAAGLRFPDWPGVHSEDVAFTYDVWLHGFDVAYIPGRAVHPITEFNIGATKAQTANLMQHLAVNKQALGVWMDERGVIDAARAGRIPIGEWEMPNA